MNEVKDDMKLEINKNKKWNEEVANVGGVKLRNWENTEKNTKSSDIDH